jgi:hypothetical protein
MKFKNRKKLMLRVIKKWLALEWGGIAEIIG